MSTVSNRFDQKPDRPYGYCTTCSPRLEFTTKAAADEHMHSTFKAARAQVDGALGVQSIRGHGIRATNPERQANIDCAVGQIVEDAINEAIDEISQLTYPRRGTDEIDATREEITEALRKCYDGFADAWAEYLEETDEDDE